MYVNFLLLNNLTYLDKKGDLLKTCLDETA